MGVPLLAPDTFVVRDRLTPEGAWQPRPQSYLHDTIRPMNKQAAAALALLGWYLMLPPITKDGRVDSNAQLKQWHVDGRFDSERECDHMRDTLRHITVLARRANDPPEQVEIAADHQAVCVASDDPRLAK